MEMVNLEKEGFSNYVLYSNGQIKNLKTSMIRDPARYVELRQDGKQKTFSLAVLMRRYFGNELMTLPKNEVMNLDFIGFPDYEVTADGRIWSHKTESWMKLSLSENGYPNVSLTNGIQQKNVKIHRLVAQAFIPNPYGYTQIRHKDGCKLHCGFDNLEWISNVENVKQAILRGDKKSVLAEPEIELACRMIMQGFTDTEIAKRVQVKPANIYHIRAGHTHCEISKKYGIEPHRITGRHIDYSKYPKNHQHQKYTPKVSTV